jgi:hypothetical protein
MQGESIKWKDILSKKEVYIPLLTLALILFLIPFFIFSNKVVDKNHQPTFNEVVVESPQVTITPDVEDGVLRWMPTIMILFIIGIIVGAVTRIINKIVRF